MNGFIYKITNNINGKCYIGKTTKTIEERFKEHLKESSLERAKDRPLYRAIQKYGKENFSIEMIEIVPLDFLSEKECYWIGYYHSYGDGYNATLGGDGKVLYDYDLIADMIKEKQSAKEIMEKIGCCRDLIRDIAKKLDLEVFVPETKLQIEMKNSSKKIKQFDLSRNYLRSFNSAAEAGKWLVSNGYAKNYTGGVRSHILDVCNRKRKTAYKFLWEFE